MRSGIKSVDEGRAELGLAPLQQPDGGNGGSARGAEAPTDRGMSATTGNEQQNLEG